MTYLSEDMTRLLREERDAQVEVFLDAMARWLQARMNGDEREEWREDVRKALGNVLDCVIGV